MNVTRDVINDLLPAYFAGDASADTRYLVEEYFRQDAAFEREARSSAGGLEILDQTGTKPVDSRIEETALKRAKRLLRIQTILFALASTFSLNLISLGFSFEVGNGYTRVHWLALPGQGKLLIAILAMATVFWVIYFFVRRRVKIRVLG